MEGDQIHYDLSFRQAIDKVKFSTILIVRRLEDNDEEIPNAFYTFSENGFNFVPTSSTFFHDPEGLHELVYVVAARIVRENRARMIFLVCSMFDPSDQTKEIVALGGQSSDELETWQAPITRRNFGKPLIGRWIRTDMPSMAGMLSEAAKHLTS